MTPRVHGGESLAGNESVRAWSIWLSSVAVFFAGSSCESVSRRRRSENSFTATPFARRPEILRV